MPKLEIEGHGSHEVVTGTRLVLAIRDAGVAIGHRCGGHGRCTTCRVEFLTGEPQRMTAAEKEKLDATDLEGARLACQILVEDDMHVRALMTVENQSWDGPGSEPEANMTPEAVWVER